jgi:hypothetical protein
LLQGNPRWIYIEREVAELGFFTPSSKRTQQVIRKAVVTNGHSQRRGEISIIADGRYGLPITADQDKLFAFQALITTLRARAGKVQNPVSFTSAALLRLLRRRVTAGKNYTGVAEWLRRMNLTQIHSSGGVYLAGRKLFGSGVFRVFEAVVESGGRLPSGKTADKNYVWLSDWQLQNLNCNHVLGLDLSAYCNLRHRISKTMVPLITRWILAEQNRGATTEIPYHTLCSALNIHPYRHLSKIREKLQPSFQELVQCGQLASWEIRADSHRCVIAVAPGALLWDDSANGLMRDYAVRGGTRRQVARF